MKKLIQNLFLLTIVLSVFAISSVPAFAGATEDKDSLKEQKEKALENLSKTRSQLNNVSDELQAVSTQLKTKSQKFGTLNNEVKALQDRFASLQDEKDDLTFEVSDLEKMIQETFSNLYEQKISLDYLGKFTGSNSGQSFEDLQHQANLIYTSNGQDSNFAQLTEIQDLINELNKQGSLILGQKSNVEGELTSTAKEKADAQAAFDDIHDDFSDLFSKEALASKDLNKIKRELDIAQQESNNVGNIIRSKKGAYTPPAAPRPAPVQPTTPAPTSPPATSPPSGGSGNGGTTPPATAPPVTAPPVTAPPAPPPPPPAANFIKPVNAYISSYFGNKFHPILKRWILHAGVDFGASYGTSIKSTNAGVVIYSGTMSGYGNVVIVDHGNSVTSLYAHMSSIAVGYGSHVGRGQTVGYVGSTGNVTGPHLHFEIRKNGTPVNPFNYI